METMTKLYVCSQCLQAIESHEGPQFKREFYQDDEDPMVMCELCGDAIAEYIIINRPEEV